MKRIKWFEPPFKGCPTMWTLCTTEDEYHRAQRSAGLTRDEQLDWCISPSSLAGALTHFEDRVIIVCAPLGTRVGILAHEAVHVWQHMMLDIGEHTPGDEQAAYGIQHIVETLVESMQERVAASKPKRRPKCTTMQQSS